MCAISVHILLPDYSAIVIIVQIIDDYVSAMLFINILIVVIVV